MTATEKDPLLTTAEVATQLRVSTQTLESWRTKGVGPRFVKLPSRVLYRTSEIDRFLAESERQKARG